MQPAKLSGLFNTGGAVAAPDNANDKASLPFGIGLTNFWWEFFSNSSMAEQSRFRGPLVGFAFLESFIGVYPLLVPHPRCLLSLGATMRAQPGPLELVDTTGEACVRFRWWKIKPLGKDLEESASRLRGCDLVIRNDIWDDLVSKLKPPIVFETKVTERALKSGED